MRWMDKVDINSSNAVRNAIRNMANAIQIYFPKCDDCKGTGLAGVSKTSDGDHSWDGSMCETCKGTGYKNWEDNLIFEVCDKCRGAGCSRCNDRGYVDWVQKARGI